MTALERTIDLLQLFGDATRVRLMALLCRDAFTVAELTSIVELGQSRVSAHLARLKEAGLLRDERRGTATLYSADEAALPPDARELWTLVRAKVSGAILEGDARRADSVKRAREKRSWPERVAGEMERHYSPGRTWESLAHGFALLADLGDVLDVGCGDGSVASMLAPRATAYTCLDASEAMIAAAKKRLGDAAHARFEVARAEAMPFADATFDTVLLFNVLAYSKKPSKVLTECARVMRPGGKLVVVTLAAHEHRDLTHTYGHENAGFEPGTLSDKLASLGLHVDVCAPSVHERRPPFLTVLTALARKPPQERSRAHKPRSRNHPPLGAS